VLRVASGAQIPGFVGAIVDGENVVDLNKILCLSCSKWQIPKLCKNDRMFNDTGGISRLLLSTLSLPLSDKTNVFKNKKIAKDKKNCIKILPHFINHPPLD